jgi:heat-inducible transcriptional repressor
MSTPTGQDDLSARDREILRAIVSDFISTGEPVGSQAVAPRCDVSPATVRSVMSDLEALGYLEKPHTSAGRVPTDRGLRLYVDALLKVRAPHPRERERIERGLHPAAVQDLMGEAGKVLHELTHHAAVVLAPDMDQTIVRRIELVRLREDRVLAVLVTQSGVVHNRLITVEFPVSREELEHATNYLNELLGELTVDQVQVRLRAELEAERALYDDLVKKSLEIGSRAFEGAGGPPRMLIEGEASFLDQPEFAEDVARMRALFAELARKDRLIELLRRAVDGHEIRIFIGAESDFSATAGVSVITAPYGSGEGSILGALAVIGPTRMNYGKVIPLVEYTARAVSRSLVEP